MTLWIPGSKNVSGLQSSVSNKNYVDQDSPAPLVNGTIDMFAMCILCILIFAPVICTRIEWVNMVDQSICSFCNQLLEHVFQALHSLPCSLKTMCHKRDEHLIDEALVIFENCFQPTFWTSAILASASLSWAPTVFSAFTMSFLWDNSVDAVMNRQKYIKW